MPRRINKYTTVKIPNKLVELIDNFLDNNPEYTSRTDIIKESLRNYFREK